MAQPTPEEKENARQWNQRQQAATTVAANLGVAAAAQSEDEEEGSADEPVVSDERQKELARRMRREKMTSQDRLEKDLIKARGGGEGKDEETEETTTGGQAPKKFGAVTFIAALSLAAVKDAIDFLTLGWIGVLVNVVVTPTLLLVMVTQGGSLMEFFKKRKNILALGAIAEFIPVLSFVPVWTVTVIWAKMESDRGGKVSVKEVQRGAASLSESAPVKMLSKLKK